MSDGSSPSIAASIDAERVDLLIHTDIATPVEIAPPLVGFPVTLTSFIGRAQEQATLAGLLTRDDVRLTTLTGPGGIGKTRLATQVAERLVEQFADGALFVPLATVADAADTPAAILRALGMPDADPDPAMARLQRALGGQQRLIVLDNFEQLARNAPESGLPELLQANPGLKVLTTSRVRLRLSGEHVMAVPPLTVADASGSAAITSISEAVQLFVSRLQAVRADFVLTPQNEAIIAEICRRVDGLPLAIELAAARGAVLSLPELLSRLQRRLPLLSGGPRDQPERLRTMQSAIAWSYDLLEPPAQRLLRHLSVFSGGATVTAAEAVASPGGGAETLDALGDLVNNSLLQRADASAGSRLLLLETVREFAAEQLAQAGEAEGAQRAHARHFARYMEEIDPRLWRSASGALLDEIGQEHDNLRAALEWSLVNNPEQALGLAQRVGAFWQKRTFWNEGRGWLNRALEAAPATLSLDRAIATWRAGALAGDQGDYPEAIAHMMAALQMATDLGDALTAARVLRGLGIVASNQSDFAQANDLFSQALAQFRAAGDDAGIARVLNDLGLVAERQGDHARAIALQEESLPLARRVGDEWQVCIVLGNLGGAYYDSGEFTRGEALSREALKLSRELDDTFGVAVNLYNLGQFEVELGRPADAVTLYSESLAIIESIGEHHLLSRALDRLGFALHLLSQSREAARLHGAALALRESIGDTLFFEEDSNITIRYEQVEAALGAETFAAEVALGRTIPPAAAVAEA
ncbi:MAG: tetratricopeptide repeat protein, partial [Thermomicrobiales bacterium]